MKSWWETSRKLFKPRRMMFRSPKIQQNNKDWNIKEIGKKKKTTFTAELLWRRLKEVSLWVCVWMSEMTRMCEQFTHPPLVNSRHALSAAAPTMLSSPQPSHSLTTRKCIKNMRNSSEFNTAKINCTAVWSPEKAVGVLNPSVTTAKIISPSEQLAVICRDIASFFVTTTFITLTGVAIKSAGMRFCSFQ